MASTVIGTLTVPAAPRTATAKATMGTTDTEDPFCPNSYRQQRSVPEASMSIEYERDYEQGVDVQPRVAALGSG